MDSLFNGIFHQTVQTHIVGHCKNDRLLVQFRGNADMRIVNAELEYLVFEPRKEFITMVVLAVGNIPLLYFLNQSWYDTLMHTIPGQIMLAVTGAIIFVSTACVIKLTKPIEYRT